MDVPGARRLDREFDADLARGDSGTTMDTKKFCWEWKDRLRAANAEQPDAYLLRNRWDANDQLIDGSWTSPCQPAWQQRYTAQLELLIAIGAEAPRLLPEFRRRVAVYHMGMEETWNVIETIQLTRVS